LLLPISKDYDELEMSKATTFKFVKECRILVKPEDTTTSTAIKIDSGVGALTPIPPDVGCSRSSGCSLLMEIPIGQLTANRGTIGTADLFRWWVQNSKHIRVNVI